MKRNAFTLVELIFAIVIIGVLAAVAVPKYKQLEENSQIANITKYYSDILTSAKSAYLNETKLNDVNASDTNLTSLYDFKGKGWIVKNVDFATYTTTIGGTTATMKVAYNNAGSLEMNTTISGAAAAKTRIENKLTSKTSMTFSSDKNITTIDLAE